MSRINVAERLEKAERLLNDALELAADARIDVIVNVGRRAHAGTVTTTIKLGYSASPHQGEPR